MKSSLIVGDRVSIDGREEVYFVLSVDDETGSACLLPVVRGGDLVNDVPLDSVKYVGKRS